MTHRLKEAYQIKSNCFPNKNNIEFFTDLITVFNQIPGYVYWKNLDSIYMGCNGNLAEFSGLSSPVDIVGMTDADFLWGRGLSEEFRENDLWVIRERKTLTTENIMPQKRADGNYLVIRTDKAPLYDANNNVIGVIGVATDITENHTLKQQLKRNSESLVHAYAAKSEFIDSISYDFCTPIQGIISLAKNIESRIQDNRDKIEVQLIKKSATRVYNNLSNVFDNNSLELKNSNFTFFSLKDMIHELSEMFSPFAITKSLSFKFHIDHSIPDLLATNRNNLSHILFNLVGNAIKFTNHGGVKLIAQLHSSSSSKLVVKLIIEDTGIGIHSSKHELIFQKPTYSNLYNDGLSGGRESGLHSVLRYLNEINGEITLRSEEGCGSIFTVFLPMTVT